MADRSRRRSGFGLTWLLVTELVVLVLFVPVPRILQAMDIERAMTWNLMGEATSSWIINYSDDLYRSTLIDTGVREAVFNHVIPTREERARSRGLQHLGTGWWFPFLEKRLTASFLVLRHLVFRIVSACTWVPFFIAIAIPATMDAMMMWRKRNYEWEYASPMVHRWGEKTLKNIPVLFALVLFAPLPLPPLTHVGLAVLGALGIHMIGKHLPRMI